MKDGRTYLAHKAVRAIDRDNAAAAAVTVQGAARGGTTMLDEILGESGMAVAFLRSQNLKLTGWVNFKA